MEIISGFLSQTQPKPQSALDTIIRLCDRLLNSTMLEDRRGAALGIKGMAREYRESVATSGLKALMLTLERDREDVETCRAALETLIILFLRTEEDSAEQDVFHQRVRNKHYPSPLQNGRASAAPAADGIEDTKTDYVSLWLADEFSQREAPMANLLTIVSEADDFYCRLYALQLLAAILSHRPQRAQECIFSSGFGISTLVGLLDVSNEVIRNEAVLVLKKLTVNNADIQKVIAFEGAFDKVFEVIASEEYLLGGIIVENCLDLIASLLRYNVSNQHYFRETNCIPHLRDLLSITDPETGQLPMGWNDQTWINLAQVLEIVRLFVPEGHEATSVNQHALCNSGMLESVLQLAFGYSTTLQIRSSSLITCSDLIRSNTELQADFLRIDVPFIDLSIAEPPVTDSMVTVAQALLNWSLLTTSVHAFDLRVGAMRCLDAAFKDNEAEKVEFLRDQIAIYQEPSQPDSADHHRLHSSQHANLISALVDYDPSARLNPYKTWFGAVILLHIFDNDGDSTEARDLLRAMKIGDHSQGEDESTAIQAMSGLLTTSLQNNDPRITIAYLMLLTYWNFDDVAAVHDFLEESGTIQALIAVVTHTTSTVNPIVESMATILLGVTYDFCSKESPISRQNLHTMLLSSIGRDQYLLKVQKLREVSLFKSFDRDDHFFSEARDPATGLPQVYFDAVYVDLIKENFSRILKSLDRDPDYEPNSRISLEMYDQLQAQFRDTTEQLTTAQKELEELKQDKVSEVATLNEEIERLNSKLESNRLQQNQFEESHRSLESEKTKLSNDLKLLQDKHSALETDKKTLVSKHGSVNNELSSANKRIQELVAQEKQIEQKLSLVTAAKDKAESGINKMNKELMTLTKEKNESDKKIKSLNKEKAELSAQMDELNYTRDQLIDKLKYAAQTIEDLKASVGDGEARTRAAVAETNEVKLHLASAQREIDAAKKTIEKLRKEKQELQKQATELSESLSQSEAANIQNGSTIDRLTDELKSATARLEETQRAIDSTQSELDSVKKQAEQARSEKAGSDQAIIELKSELKITAEGAKQEKEALEISHGDLKRQFAEKEAALIKLEENLKKQLSKKDSAFSKLESELKQKLNEKESALSQLEEKLKSQEADLHKEIASLKDQLSKALAEKSEAVEKSEQLARNYEAELEGTKKVHTEEVESLKSKVSEKESEMQELSDNLEKAKGSLSDKITSLEAGLSSKGKEIELLKKEHGENIESLQSEIKEKAAQIVKSESIASEKFKKAESDLSKLKGSLAEKESAYSKELKKQTKEKDALLKELDDAKASAAAAAEAAQSEKRKELEDLASRHKEEVDELQLQLEEAQAESAQHNEKASDGQLELNNLKNKHKREAQKLQKQVDKATAEVTRLKKEKEEIENSLAAEKNVAIDQLKETHGTELEAIKAEMTELKKVHAGELDSHVRELSELKQKHDKEQTDYQERRTKLELDHSEELQVLKTQLSELQSALMTARQEKDDLKSKHDIELKGLEEKLSELKSDNNGELKALKEKLLEAKSNNEDELKALQEKLTGFQLEKDELESKHSSELKDLQERLAIESKAKDEATEMTLKYENEIKDMRSTFEEDKKKLESQIAEHERQLTVADSKRDEISTLRDAQQKELNEVNAKLEALSTENEACKKSLEEAKKESEELGKKFTEANKELTKLAEKQESQESELKSQMEHVSSLSQSEEALLAEVKGLKEQLAAKEEDTALKSDMEDLMLMLTELDEKNKRYKALLRKHNEDVSDDGSDSDDDADDDDDDDEDDE